SLPILWLAVKPSGRVLFSSFRLLPRAASSWRTRLAWVPDAALALAAMAMALALAGPRVQEGESRLKREGISIMMVVDTSSSMRALDLSDNREERTRLDVVKDVFIQFVAGGGGLSGRPDDSIGIVSFARYADTRCPLTLNHGSVVQIARDLEIVQFRAEDGTAIGDGLALAVERLREAKTKSKVAILLTDGVNNSGEEAPLAAADLAAKLGIKVYTIGAGSNRGGYQRSQGSLGFSILTAAEARLDEETLKAIAERTGGQYFRAGDAEGLVDVYRRIDQLERTEISEQRLAEYEEYYIYALALALILACLGWLLRASVFRRLPC
ncbi:MAG: VWA domain-containing protein, partial [Myxococcota bacterium]